MRSCAVSGFEQTLEEYETRISYPYIVSPTDVEIIKEKKLNERGK
jgi:hypothetical protein